MYQNPKNNSLLYLKDGILILEFMKYPELYEQVRSDARNAIVRGSTIDVCKVFEDSFYHGMEEYESLKVIGNRPSVDISQYEYHIPNAI